MTLRRDRDDTDQSDERANAHAPETNATKTHATRLNQNSRPGPHASWRRGMKDTVGKVRSARLRSR